MTDEKLLSIAERFDLEGAIASIKPLGEGFINDTFVIRTEATPPITFFSARTMRYSPTCPG